MGSSVAKKFGLTNIAKKKCLGSISHFFFPNLDEIDSLLVQAATVLYFLAKNIGAIYLRFMFILDGSSLLQNYVATQMWSKTG